MYIQPYWAGVLTVIAVEIIAVIGITIHATIKSKGGKK